MKTQLSLVCVALWASTWCGLPAQAGPADEPGSPARTAVTPSPRALAQYQKALASRQRAENDLRVARALQSKAAALSAQSRAVTDWLKYAETSARERGELLRQLPDKLQTATRSREAAWSAIAAYQQAADAALRAAEAFARADEKAAEASAGEADAASAKKAAQREAAERAVAAAIEDEEALGNFLSRLAATSDRVDAHLATAAETGAKMLAQSDELLPALDGQSKALQARVRDAVDRARAAGASIVRQIGDTREADREAYGPPIDELRDFRARQKDRQEALRAYFALAVHAATRTAAHAFMQALAEADQGDKNRQDEATASADSMRAALARAEAARQEGEQALREAKAFVAGITERTGPLPPESAAIEAVVMASAVPSHAYAEAQDALRDAVSTRETVYQKALAAEQRAFKAAYGYEPRERRLEMARPSPKMAAPAPDRGVAGERMEIREHVYAHVYELVAEPKGYGAYTYVLFSQDVDKTQPHIRARYEALLKAIYRSTTEMHKFTAPIPPEKLNLFCIPVAKSADGHDKYDADLARSYLATAGNGAILRKDIIKLIRRSPGPFLLTTRTRLSEGGAQKQLLFVDLSTYPAESFDSILATYKETLVEQPPQGQELWTPPALQRVLYAALDVAAAAPKVAETVKKITDFFIPSASAATK